MQLHSLYALVRVYWPSVAVGKEAAGVFKAAFQKFTNSIPLEDKRENKVVDQDF